jgi:thioredoxin 1
LLSTPLPEKYFTATWCPPCKVISPAYEDLSKSYASEIAFGKVDVDDNAEAAGNFGISSVPTFIFLHGNDIVSKFSGAERSKLETSILALKDKV